MNEERTYGVEIEINRTECLDADLGAIARAMTRSGVSAVAASYGSSDQPVGGRWKVLPDASCGPEIVSPPLRGKAGLEEINQVCGILQGLGAQVSATCGLHVHHDAAGFTVQDMVAISSLYAAHQRAINSILPASRRNNAYCVGLGVDHVDWRWQRRVNASRDVGSAVTAMASTRYSAVNWWALPRHGTVEFRQHDGTVEFPAIRSWVLLTQGMVEAALARKSPVKKLRQPTGRKHTGYLAEERELLSDLLYSLSKVAKGDPDYREIRKFYEDRLFTLSPSS